MTMHSWRKKALIVVWEHHINGLAQDCSNTIALAMELPKCCVLKAIGMAWEISAITDTGNMAVASWVPRHYLSLINEILNAMFE